MLTFLFEYTNGSFGNDFPYNSIVKIKILVLYLRVGCYVQQICFNPLVSTLFWRDNVSSANSGGELRVARIRGIST